MKLTRYILSKCQGSQNVFHLCDKKNVDIQESVTFETFDAGM